MQVEILAGVEPGDLISLRDPGVEESSMAAKSSAASASTFRRSNSLRSSKTFTARPICKHGAKCYRRNPQHLSEESHPFEGDYLHQCRLSGTKPEIISIRQLFMWCDEGSFGKVTREAMAKSWPLFQEMSNGLGPLDDAMWTKLDDDGNGCANFGEFAEFAKEQNIDLPLGLDDLFAGQASSSDGPLRCGVVHCLCARFFPARGKCKYGGACYQKGPEHTSLFCHPGDADWETNSKYYGKDMCTCGHKRKLHSSSKTGAAAFPLPPYWSSKVDDAGNDFNSLTPVDGEMFAKLQELLDVTYRDVTTRDRVRSCGTWEVPRSFRLVAAARNENSKLWRKYCVRKAELQHETSEDPYKLYDDVLTTSVWESLSADAQLDRKINEWYLFHGSSTTAARNICINDFKFDLAGSATGTLYGRGSYFAESITKADEYTREEDGKFTVLLNRVLGGRVKYNADREPDPDELTRECVDGPYDSVLGDRQKISGTYREFVVFDTENVYPEYILTFERGEFFKSPSHP